MSKRILVLGGNGFIGAHLVETLAASGERVRVFDRAGSLKGQPLIDVDYRYANFDDSASLAEALIDVDIVVHLISTTVPGTSNLNPVEDIEGNLINTVKLLQQMRDIGVSRLVYLSSGGTVYGNTTQMPISEDHSKQPLSSYGIVKVAIENYISMFSTLHGLDALVIRASNPYGPRQGHLGVQGVIPTFFQRIISGDTIQVWGDGSNIRDYIFISDLVSFIVDSFNCKLTSGVYNIGSGEGTSLMNILSLVSAVANVPVTVEHLPPRGFDVKNVVLDISKARKAMDWQPKISLQEGCERYWHWAKGVGVF